MVRQRSVTGAVLVYSLLLCIPSDIQNSSICTPYLPRDTLYDPRGMYGMLHSHTLLEDP